MHRSLKYILPILIIALILPACSSRPKISRLDENEVTDLSGKWNDTDSRLVSDEMVASMLDSGWRSRWSGANEKNPALIVGRVKNETMEHINTKAFVADIEHAMIESGKIAFVADGNQRDSVRQERLDQLSNASEETIKEFGREIGADFMLFGSIITFTDQSGGAKIVSYQIDMKLIDIENNTVAWTGQKKIKKEIRRRRFKL